jgi:hypothetical protein
MRNTCFHIFVHVFHILQIFIMLADSQPSIDYNIANLALFRSNLNFVTELGDGLFG